MVRDLTDDRVAVLTRAVGHLTGEAHLLKGFTRFSEQEGVLVGEIAPKTGLSIKLALTTSDLSTS